MNEFSTETAFGFIALIIAVGIVCPLSIAGVFWLVEIPKRVQAWLPAYIRGRATKIEGGSKVGDVLYVGVVIVSFAILWAFAKGCEVLRKE